MKQTNAAVELEKTVKKSGKSGLNVRAIAFIGLMGAMSSILMLLRFPLPFLPPFLTFDLSGFVEMLGGFMFGPLAALLIVVVKILLQLVIQGSLSFGVGEVQNLILSCAYLLPALLFYQYRKDKKTAALGMTVSTVVVSVVSVLTNLYMIIPFYAKLSGLTMQDIVMLCNTVNPAVTDALGMVVMGILPFNLIKYGVTSLLTFLVYKRLSKVIKGIVLKEETENRSV